MKSKCKYIEQEPKIEESESKKEVLASDLEMLSKSVHQIRESIIRYAGNDPIMDMLRGKIVEVENKINQMKG